MFSWKSKTVRGAVLYTSKYSYVEQASKIFVKKFLNHWNMWEHEKCIENNAVSHTQKEKM